MYYTAWHAVDAQRMDDRLVSGPARTHADQGNETSQKAIAGVGMTGGGRHPADGHGDRPPPEPDTVDALRAGLGGRWLVTTRTSRHVWDLDLMTFQRLVGPDSPKLRYDGAVVRITRIGVYPAVGISSLVFYDDQVLECLEHWRISSTIVSINRLPNESDEPDFY